MPAIKAIESRGGGPGGGQPAAAVPAVAVGAALATEWCSNRGAILVPPCERSRESFPGQTRGVLEAGRVRTQHLLPRPLLILVQPCVFAWTSSSTMLRLVHPTEEHGASQRQKLPSLDQ